MKPKQRKTKMKAKESKGRRKKCTFFLSKEKQKRKPNKKAERTSERMKAKQRKAKRLMLPPQSKSSGLHNYFVVCAELCG
jgi:hypothetical protein